MTSRRARSSNKRNGRFYLLIPIVAVVLVSTTFALSYFHSTVLCSTPPSRPATMDFQDPLTIKFVNKYGNASVFIVPRNTIGVAGGVWETHAYDSYGTDGRYPLCMDGPGQNGGTYKGYTPIVVRSNTEWNYTLRDLFNVWGQPLGENQTLTSSYIPPIAHYVWNICRTTISDPSGGQRPGNWTYEPLVPGKWLILTYYPTNTNYAPCG